MMNDLKTVQVIIDGSEYDVPADATILSAARSVGIAIPSLCYMKNSGNCAACQICSVEIAGIDILKASCSTLISSGMEISTRSDKVRSTRKRILEMILATHDQSCGSCRKERRCNLKKWKKEYGIESMQTFEEITEPDNDGFYLSEGKCILCMKCVTVCRNMARMSMLSPALRGLQTTINHYGDPEVCNSCRRCEKICPVNAISIK